MSSPNHYEALGLAPSASAAEVARRYAELARLYQIDTAAPPAEGMAGLIVEAFRVLSNPSLRAAYDAGLALTSETGKQGDAQATATHSVLSTQNSALSTQHSALDTTLSWPAPTPDTRHPTPDDKRIAAELLRRGIPPDEVERLVALGKAEPAAAPKGKSAALVSPPPVPPSEPYVPQPTITLPPFREATAQQRAEADRLLTTANVARRRDNYREAERACLAALELVPNDAAALELFGDIMQAVGRVDDALYAYDRATEADPSRKTAEKKYADLLLRQNREIELLRQEYLPRNATLAVLLSAVLPGAGQIYNGEPLKGALVAVAFFALVFVIFYTPYGIPHQRAGIPASLALSIILAGLVYIVGVVDANMVARRGKRAPTGWEV